MRNRQALLETFNKTPRPEGVIQNQWLLMEVLCDIRDLLYGKQDNGFKAPFDDDEPKQKTLKSIDEPI